MFEPGSSTCLTLAQLLKPGELLDVGIYARLQIRNLFI